jgi:hypothetical protein
VRIDLGVKRWDRWDLVAWPYEEGYSLQHMEGHLSEEGPLSIWGKVWEVVGGG